jgi:hypothetical protein
VDKSSRPYEGARRSRRSPASDAESPALVARSAACRCAEQMKWSCHDLMDT